MMPIYVICGSMGNKSKLVRGGVASGLFFFINIFIQPSARPKSCIVRSEMPLVTQPKSGTSHRAAPPLVSKHCHVLPFLFGIWFVFGSLVVLNFITPRHTPRRDAIILIASIGATATATAAVVARTKSRQATLFRFYILCSCCLVTPFAVVFCSVTATGCTGRNS